MNNESIKSGCKPLEIIDDGTRFVDDGKLHKFTINIDKAAELIARKFYKEIDDAVFKKLSKKKLIELRQRIDIELQEQTNEK